MSGLGDATRYVDTVPGMGDAIGNASPEAVRVCDRQKLTGAGSVSFASIFGMIPGATLVQLARKQAQLLDRKVLSESGCQQAGLHLPWQKYGPRLALALQDKITSVLLSCPRRHIVFPL